MLEGETEAVNKVREKGARGTKRGEIPRSFPPDWVDGRRGDAAFPCLCFLRLSLSATNDTLGEIVAKLPAHQLHFIMR